MKQFLALAAVLGAFSVYAATPHDTAAGEQRFRDLYKELVETNTSLSVGSCTLAAERMAARLKAAGFPDSDLHPFAAPDHPKDGGLVVVYAGRNPKLKAILLLAHLDVVEAKREDWTRDPFTLDEENGSFFARGAMDDKAEAAIWVDLLIRYRAENYRPSRTLKIALTCGEETAAAFNGAEWLTQNRRDLIDAAFALNEGAWGELDASGHRVSHDVEAGEKSYQDYRLEVTNPGGHSSRPVKDNAIYHLAAALTKISAYEFPVQFNDVNRAYFVGMAKIQAAKGETAVADAMTRSCGTRAMRVQSPSSLVATRVGTRRCARLASPRCSTPAMRQTHCRNARGQTSTAVSFRAFPWRACAQSLRSSCRTQR
jgi:acetylornithine deacetylase/succinyl-diaminopimelate desuccinylase-like protein